MQLSSAFTNAGYYGSRHEPKYHEPKTGAGQVAGRAAACGGAVAFMAGRKLDSGRWSIARTLAPLAVIAEGNSRARFLNASGRKQKGALPPPDATPLVSASRWERECPYVLI